MINSEETERNVVYKKWWFWGAIILIIYVFACIGISSNNVNTDTSANTNNTDYLQNLEKDYEDNIKVRNNPYEITKDYDGLYKFLLNSSNNKDKIAGIIKFNNGNCEMKYGYDLKSEVIIENKGFCGLNREDNSTFYFTLNNDSSRDVRTYKCVIDSTNFLCELKSRYDIGGNSNKELKLEKLENLIDINTALKQVLQEEERKEQEEKARKKQEEKARKEQEEKEFKESCQTYTFEQLARNPDNFKGTNVKLTGEVVQVMEGLYSNSLRVNITKEGRYTTYYKDTVYVNYVPKQGEDKILEDDIITIYGTAQGDYSYTSTMGATITLPFIDGKYITINK